MARREGLNGLRLFLRQGSSEHFGRLVRQFDFKAPHQVDVQLNASAGPVALALDGLRLGGWPLTPFAIADHSFIVGWNVQGASDCSSRFYGPIDAVASTVPAAGPLLAPRLLGDREVIRLQLGFAAVGAVSEPLVAAGEPGSASVVFVRRPDASHVVFGAQRAGGRPVLSEPVPLSDEDHHIVEIALGPRFLRGDSALAPDAVRVTLDGARVLDARQAVGPFAPDAIYLLDNPLGVPSVATAFQGPVGSMEFVNTDQRAAALLAELRQGSGPVTADLQFNGSVVAAGLGLLETGRTGAGDIVSVFIIDRTHVRFNFDHWGVGGLTGQPVAIDPAHVYRCQITMGSLYPANATAAELHTVRVELDGRTVLSGQSPCHPAGADQLYFLANALGSSGVAGPFDGTCVAARRGP